jgi:hypothetical protein
MSDADSPIASFASWNDERRSLMFPMKKPIRVFFMVIQTD